MIDGVAVYPLKKIPDERGAVMHMLRSDDPHFERFGEIYFSCVNPGAIKGWHLHTRIGLNYAVVSGMVKVVIYDDRAGSPTKGELTELFVGDEDHDDMGFRIFGELDPGMKDRVVYQAAYSRVGDTTFNGLWQGVEDEGKIETETIDVNVGYRYPFTEKFSAGGRIGATYVDVNETEDFGGEPYASSASETIPYGGLVARFAVNESWGITAFYDHYPDVGKVGQTGEGDLEVFGVSFDFRFGGSNSDD